MKVNSKYSNWYQVKSGIPQGSVLGPLMFIMFINDITEVCSKNEAHIYLFADDAKLCRHIVHESDYELLQTALSKLQDWFESWLLKLNIQKCKAVSYGRNVNKDFKYRMLQEGTKMTVQRDDHIKDLLHGSECSRRERKFHLWTFCSRNESAEEQKSRIPLEFLE